MLKITILSVGKIKESYYQDIIDEYLKRLLPYARVDFEVIKPEPFYDNSDKEGIKNKEGEKIVGFLDKNKGGRVFVMDERGREFTSGEFSGKLHSGTEPIVFVIGGSLGLSQDVLNYPGAQKIALSKMTFLHEMTQVILMEQIYRAVAIDKGKKYHY
ncbi:23S rRNA (pseudouridine(1915)-N(3))-methyltransferase RlmH [Patescibacteria group bacterium]